MVDIITWFHNIKIIKWFIKLRKIVNNYDRDREGIYSNIEYVKSIANSAEGIAISAEQVIRDRTNLNVGIDISTNAPNQIIVVGRYKGTDYVEVFSILDPDFNATVDRLREQQKYAGLKHIDSPISMKGVISQRLKW